MTSDRSFHNGNHHQRGYNSRTRPNYQPSRQYNFDDYVSPNAYNASFAQYEYSARQFRNGNHQQRGYNSRRSPNYQTSRQYNLDDYVNPNAYDASFAQYKYIARQFRNDNHQQEGYIAQYNIYDYVNSNAYDASFAQYDYTDRQFRNGYHQQRRYNSCRRPNYQPYRQYDLDDYVNPNAYDASFAQYEYTDRQFRNGYHQQRRYNSRRRPNYQPSRQYDLDDYVNPNAYDALLAQYEYTDRQFRNGYHQQRQQQRGNNSCNAPRRPKYQPSRQYDLNDYVNPNTYDASFTQYEYIDRQFRNSYHQQRSYNACNAPRRHNYQSSRHYDLDDYINPHPIHAFQPPLPYYYSVLESLGREFRDFVFVLDHEDDHGDVLKYLKIRIHHAPEVVAPDVESDICQSEYENEENIGALQCGHEYHTDCIKQWLMRKTDCPMCRASVLPSQEQKL
ncbi:hypothetical protein H5410_053528 [Solanum commersonii]|uniref:RING-type E3 ubiquitin transferase n=1 Tax=Solanum commersonii TaxID=4109 RepID=A0A9J5X648_SOLCO|nr:hypothetical protein H5410_053528 [Solanum commersonii]